MRIIGVIMAAGMASSAANAMTLTEIWRVDGFANPESAIYDPATDAIYVSNVNGDAMKKDGNGFISKVSPDGKMVAKEWVAGLDSPTGLAISGGKLYAADVDQIVVIDIAGAKTSTKIPAAGAKFLNDATSAADGTIYLSDMVADAVWQVKDGKASILVQDEALENPNGVLAESGHIIIASWGRMASDFSTKVPGFVKVVDLNSKKVTPLGSTTPVGNLDGIESDGHGGYIASDWMTGGILHIAADGKAEKVLPLPQGSADIGIITSKQILLVPMMKDNQLVAYQMK